MHIKKADTELQIVWGEVYIPGFPDVDGDYMTEEEVAKMAYRFMEDGRGGQIDLQHDNELIDAAVVETFIARSGDPDFIEGAWVIAVHISDAQVWAGVKDETYNGFSLEALVNRTPKVIEIELPEELSGETAENEGHRHTFTLRFAVDGTFLGGHTSIVDGHYHRITRGTLTDESEGHSHRYSFLELIEDG